MMSPIACARGFERLTINDTLSYLRPELARWAVAEPHNTVQLDGPPLYLRASVGIDEGPRQFDSMYVRHCSFKDYETNLDHTLMCILRFGCNMLDANMWGPRRERKAPMTATSWGVNCMPLQVSRRPQSVVLPFLLISCTTAITLGAVDKRFRQIEGEAQD